MTTLSECQKRQLRAHGTKVSISVVPVPFGKTVDLDATQGAVELWCRQKLVSNTFEVTPLRPLAWTKDCATFDVLCNLKSDSERVTEFFNHV